MQFDGGVAMKYIKINSKLLNHDKQWRHLSHQQREHVYDLFRDEYVQFLIKNRWHPSEYECNEIVKSVYDKLKEQNIEISFNEASKAFDSQLNKYKNINAENIV
jgi:hypothetical protein